MIIKDEIKESVRSNWVLASKKIGFELETPFKVMLNGGEKVVFGFLPKYGSKNGMIIELMAAPEFDIDQEIVDWATSNNFFYSFLNVESYLVYNEDVFREALKDWTFPYVPPAGPSRNEIKK